MEMSFPSNVNRDVPVCSTSTVNVSHSHQSFGGFVQQPVFVSGWMYVNEHGQMCGPYIKEQLYEGLTSGFLPFELPVYPVINGTITNPVPLNYFQQYPDHVSTRFAYMGMNFSDTMMSTNGSSSSQDMAIYRQDGSFEPAALMAVNPDSKSVSQSNVNDCTKESNHLKMATLPVIIFEPMTMIQKMAELMEYSYLLGMADETDDPYMRLVYASEQVSHHPPMSAGHAENEHFTYDVTSKLKTKFLGNSVDVYPVGRTRVTDALRFASSRVYIVTTKQVSLLTDNGSTKDDLKLPTDDALLTQIKDGFAEGKDLVVSVMSAMGEEQICSLKDIGPKN